MEKSAKSHCGVKIAKAFALSFLVILLLGGSLAACQPQKDLPEGKFIDSDGRVKIDYMGSIYDINFYIDFWYEDAMEKIGEIEGDEQSIFRIRGIDENIAFIVFNPNTSRFMDLGPMFYFNVNASASETTLALFSVELIDKWRESGEQVWTELTDAQKAILDDIDFSTASATNLSLETSKIDYEELLKLKSSKHETPIIFIRLIKTTDNEYYLTFDNSSPNGTKLEIRAYQVSDFLADYIESS